MEITKKIFLQSSKSTIYSFTCSISSI